MNVLPELISLLNKEEARNFKLFANRTNAAVERKDIILFDYIKKSYPGYDEEKVFKKLYHGKDKNSFYRLKNRLAEDIGISLSLLHYHATDINHILNNYLLAKLFISKNKRGLSLYYMAKAEKKANAIEAFHLLDMLYNEYIKLSHEVLDINPEDYIQKRKENRQKLNRLQEIDDVLAVVIYQVKSGQNFGKGNERINELLSKTVNTYANSPEVKNSPLLRFKIYDSLSRILLQQHNFKALEKYLLKTYTEFEKEKLFTKGNHDTKLQMLTYICNALFKNSKLDESLKYAVHLHGAMKEFSNSLYDKYLFFYYNILVNNYAKSHVEKAIEILDEAKEQKAIKDHPVYIGFVYLNLAVSYFGIKDFKFSLKSIVKLYMIDSYKKLDEAFRFKISITELIVRYELKDSDYIEQRVKQLKKDFKHSLQSEEFSREKKLIEIILLLINTASVKTDKKVQLAIKQFTRQTASAQKDEAEIINYNDWLLEKFKK
ncbi:MAG TPA: hypothetical protein VNZ49_17380 [Bacteroidia bacterium]|jgi:hypothetical protein|nr:hypothetical protein [Bacteroidia bacterium]